MRTHIVLVALICAAAVLGAVQADDEGTACAPQVAELQSVTAACQKQVQELQQQIETLKGDLSTSGNNAASAQQELASAVSKLSALEAKLNSLESDLSTTQGKLSSTETELSSTHSKLSSAETELSSSQSKLKKTESKLAAAQDELAATKATVQQGSACQRKLEKVETQLSEQASRLEQLKAVEEALLPVWLSRSINNGMAFTQAKWQQLQTSDVGAQVVTKVGPYWEKVVEATEPARQQATVYVAKAQEALRQLPVQDTINTVKKQAGNIERELLTVVQNFFTAQPALSRFNDPVTLQLVVYSIMGLPLLLLAIVLVAFIGGPAESSGSHAAGSKTGGKRPVGPPTAGKKGGAARQGGKGAAVQPAGSVKKGKAVREGADVLYTP